LKEIRIVPGIDIMYHRTYLKLIFVINYKE